MTTIFNCADCRKAIKENSREHDDCWTDMEKDDDLWYCGDCKCDHMANDDDFDEEPFFKTEEEEADEENTDLPPSFKGACADCGQIETECQLKLNGGKIMCCDCLDPKPTEEEEEDDDEEEEEDAYTCGVCGHSFKANDDIAIFADKQGRACCEYCPDEADDEESVCDDEQRSYGARGAPAPESDDDDKEECDCCGENFETVCLTIAEDAEGEEEKYCATCLLLKIEDGCVWQEHGVWVC